MDGLRRPCNGIWKWKPVRRGPRGRGERGAAPPSFRERTVVVTDGTGQVETRTEYLPYGETWFQEGDEKNSPKYNSQELDKETGYYYYNARHYDPETGRFVTADNVIDGEYSTQGWNRYMYCHGNPVMYEDPTGHFIWLIPVIACVSAAIIAGNLCDNDNTSSATAAPSSPSSGGGSKGSGQVTPPSSPGKSASKGDSGVTQAMQPAKSSDRSRTRPSGQDVKKTLIQNFERNNDGSIYRDSEGSARSKY